MAPLLPVPSLAGFAAAPVNEFQMGWVTMFARAQNRASPALIQKWLRIGPSEANAVMRELVTRGVVSAPVAGSAVAVDPLYPGGRPIGLAGKGRKMIDRAWDALTDGDNDDELFAQALDGSDSSEVEEIGVDPPPEDEQV